MRPRICSAIISRDNIRATAGGKSDTNRIGFAGSWRAMCRE